jgi:hypothetical protein
MNYIPIEFEYNFKRNPKVFDFLNQFFKNEIEFLNKTDASKIETKSLFFNFIKKHGTYQSLLFDAWLEYVKTTEYLYKQ